MIRDLSCLGINSGKLKILIQPSGVGVAFFVLTVVEIVGYMFS